MEMLIVAAVFLIVITTATVISFQRRKNCGCSRDKCHQRQQDENKKSRSS